MYYKMKYCHTITINVFVKPENIREGPDIMSKTKECIKSMVHVDWDRDSGILKTTTAEGFENRRIIIYELHLIKDSHTTQFINSLMQHLTTDQKQFLMTDKHKRLDENLEFFIRLDRQKLLHGIYELTDSGDCFHIKMTIAAFPKKRENALKIIDDMLRIA